MLVVGLGVLLGQAVDWEARRVQQELAGQLQHALKAANSRASAAEAAAKAASEQIKFFFRQVQCCPGPCAA
jgi:hypothetical protein